MRKLAALGALIVVAALLPVAPASAAPIPGRYIVESSPPGFLSNSLMAMPVTIGAPAPPGGVYGGSSSQDQAVSMWLSRDGRKLKRLLVQLNYTCESSPQTVLGSAFEFLPTRIRRDGSFAIDTGPDFRLGDRVLTARVKGRVGSAKAGGTLRFFGVAKDAAGKVVDRCDSGTVRWSARRGEGTYGGATAVRLGVPFAVSIRASRQARKLRSFFIDLAFKCGTANYLYSLEHLNIRIRRRGTFSKGGFTGIPLKFPAGTGSGRFALRGQLGPRRATGTYRAFGTLRLPDRTKLQCDTGTVRWKARRG